MGKIVMTLLVRRQPEENAECPYAVQITFPQGNVPRGDNIVHFDPSNPQERPQIAHVTASPPET